MSRVLVPATAAAALAALAVSGCGKAAPSTATGGTTNGAAAPTANTQLPATTPAATGDVAKITWATYREVGTLDPIQAFDYPENTVDTALCDALVKQQPDGTLAAGLSALPEHPDDKTTVFKLQDGAKFSDGQPVTAADVVYSLKRAADPKSGGFYPQVFARVASIAATDDHTVTLKLKQPDFWLDGELSQMAGIIYEKAYAEKQGKKFGTPGGGIVCAGPYKVGSWKAGAQLTLVKNDNYWGPDKPKVGQIDFKGVPDESSLTTGLITGGIDGSYPQALSALDQLRSNPKVTVSEGPSFAMDALVISSLKGVLGDVRVRQALSMAIDRKAYIQTVYKGGAQLPRTLANPGSWGYGREVFAADWAKLPEPTQDVAKAKQLVQEAGATGKTLTLGMTSEVSNLNSAANALRTAGEAIGLKVKFKAVSAQNFINFFTDPKAREGVDGFPTVNYPDYADPAAFYNTFVSADGTQNYSGFSDQRITELMSQARETGDADARAKLVAEAGDRIMQQLPWIPMAAPSNVLITSSKITGAPASFAYMGGPWANLIGSK
ncbi:MAG TPA: ABC transporter substrate-binding protein [Baekduia sp.]|uniref:ABC transporter substrate-binding protein n=1 Tax=Baekduia sp. TaxID=2600305 RepID=UPI002D791083|nr:ABC transporter substrate-binding protein [Baekduia sp.]HET6505868.1 ABC transporter substrate-binding protein [Baekduia sp.]